MELYLHSLTPFMACCVIRDGCSERYLDAKTEKIIGGLEKLHNDWVHYFNASLNVLVIKSRRMR